MDPPLFLNIRIFFISWFVIFHIRILYWAKMENSFTMQKMDLGTSIQKRKKENESLLKDEVFSSTLGV